jgi:integrase
LAVSGLQKGVQKLFLELPTEYDKEQAADFILASIKQENITPATRRTFVIALVYLSRYFDNKKSFDDMTSADLTDYINSYQKKHDEDPKQSWISTQRTLGHPLLKFFKWLAYPKLTAKERSRLPRDKYPAVLQGFDLQRKKGSKTPVENKDIWDDKDTAIFLKYCTDNPRLQFYHALAYQTSARPGELLQLKKGDIADNIQLDDDGKPFAYIDVGRYGKRKETRFPLISEFTIQYYQQYLATYHPDPTNREAYLFISKEYSAMSRNIVLSGDALRQEYKAFKKRKISKLLKRLDIPEEDKKHLEFLRDTKKWYPYIVRHSSLNKLAPVMNEYNFRRHAGWTKRSNMIEIYIHTLASEVPEELLTVYGVNLRKSGKKKQNERLQQEMIGPHCHFCHTTNIPGTQFCSSCNKPVTAMSYQEVMEETEQVKREQQEMKDKLDSIGQRFGRMMDMWKDMEQAWQERKKKEEEEKPWEERSAVYKFISRRKVRREEEGS